MTIFRFHGLELNTSAQTLMGPDGPVKMRDKVFQLLCVLVHNPNRVLTKERLFEELWPDTHVETNALSQTVLELRKALAGVDDSVTFVETVPKKGYRWAYLDIKVMETLGEGFSPAPMTDASLPGVGLGSPDRKQTSNDARHPKHAIEGWLRAPKARRWIKGFILGLGAIGLVVVAVVWLRRPAIPDRRPLRIFVAPFANQTGMEDQDWVTLGLPKIIGQDLNRHEEVSVIPLEPHLSHFGGFGGPYQLRYDREPLAALNQKIGFDVLIGGRLFQDRGKLVLEFAIHNTKGVIETEKMELTHPSIVTKLISQTLETKLGLAFIEMPEMLSPDPLVNELYGRGCQHLAFGEPAQAKPYFEICVNRDPDFFVAIQRLAECHDRMGHSDAAKDLALGIFDQCNPECPPLLEAGTHMLIGIADFHLRDFQGAREQFETALAIYRKAKRPLDTAGCLNWLGGIDALHRQYEQAAARYHEAWDIYAGEDYVLGLASVLSGQGDLASQRGRLEDAAQKWIRAMEYFAALGDKENQAAVLMRMADVHRLHGELDRAEAELEQAKSIFEELKTPRRIALTVNKMADLSAAQGNWDQAIERGLRAVDLFQQIGDGVNASIACNNLGCTALAQRDWSGAREFFTESRRLSEGLAGLQRREGIVFAQLGLVEVEIHLDALEDAQRIVDQAREMADESAYLNGIIDCYQAVLAFRQGRFEEALRVGLKAKSSLGDTWNSGQDAYLDAYRRSAKRGAGEPLPMDEDPLQGPSGT